MKKASLAAAAVIGCAFFYYIWVSLSDLPNLGRVDESSLQEVSGNAFSTNGKPALVSFFYTKCPDVCPFTIQDLKKLKRVLEEKGIEDEQYSILSVTLDPAFDTVPVILQYKEAFEIQSPNWLFLRGTEQQTREYAEQFNMVYEKSEEGVITHSTSMYMVDADGRIRAVHDMASGNKRVDIEKAAAHLIQLIE